MRGFGGRGHFGKKVTGKHHVKKQIHVGEHVFDSPEEAKYYIKMEGDPTVKEIVLHPEYVIIDAYEIPCYRCNGGGRVENPKTGNMNNCSLCKGKGKRTKGESRFKPDFKITYTDGRTEIIDIKGTKKGADNEAFPIRKRMFESRYGVELIVMRYKKGEWVRDR